MPTEFLQNDTLLLRAVELSDVDTLYRWENDTSQWATANTHAPYSRQQLWNYANDYDGNIYAHGSIRFIVCQKADGKAIGTIDIYEHLYRPPRQGLRSASLANSHILCPAMHRHETTHCNRRCRQCRQPGNARQSRLQPLRHPAPLATQRQRTHLRRNRITVVHASN